MKVGLLGEEREHVAGDERQNSENDGEEDRRLREIELSGDDLYAKRRRDRGVKRFQKSMSNGRSLKCSMDM